MDDPFYLRSTNANIVKEEDIDRFLQDNPDLRPYAEKYDIELRLLDQDPFTSICYWIIGQQLSVRAADSILNRFLQLVDPLQPEIALEKTIDELRSVGLSRSKGEYIQNWAKFCIEHKNDPRLLNPGNFDSAEIMKFYTQVKGIGPWTVNMYLIFVLGKMDIFAIKDLAVKKGIQLMYNLKELPKERDAIKNYKEQWGELATIGTLLSWFVLEE